MAPSKKRKRQEETYTCTICFTERISSRFPDSNPTDDCKHLINTCKTCLRDWIKSRVSETVMRGGISCPECDQLMGIEGIEDVSSKKTIEEFTSLQRRHVENETPGWFWCLSTKCKAGQVHPYVLQQSQTKQDPATTKTTQPKQVSVKKGGKSKGDKKASSTIFVCAECNYRSCVVCSKPWHQGETCEAHAKRTSGHHAIAEMKSLQAVDKISKKCPACQRPTVKNGGCQHMTCSLCGTAWCWGCNEEFTSQGCACTRAAIEQARVPGLNAPIAGYYGNNHHDL